MDLFLREAGDSVPVHFVTESTLVTWKDTLTVAQAKWLDVNHFSGQSGQVCCLPDEQGDMVCAVCVQPAAGHVRTWMKQVASLPAGCYHLLRPSGLSDSRWFNLHLYWALAQYQFSRYKKHSAQKHCQLCVPLDLDYQVLLDVQQPLCRARDLINTPNEDLHPQALSEVVRALGEQHGANVNVIEGDALLEQGFPTVHRVGRAGNRLPCFIEMNWGESSHPHLVLVGKGVCFDTGGINLKNAAGMRYMKKDMGGAACALALAELIMRSALPVRLTVMIPAVENNVSSNSMVPGDVVVTRSGLSVEITNTDAEGRLILCDALAYASESEPDLVLDFATLTGAARVALGPDVVPFYSNNDELAQGLSDAAQAVDLPFWRMPLYAPYQDYLKSDVADMMNSAETYFAGSITAALYLQRFVSAKTPWAHFDIFAWNPVSRPGRPRGGEAELVRGVFEHLKTKY